MNRTHRIVGPTAGLALVALAATLASRAEAQCPAPTNLTASDGTFCQGVAITWSGTRVGPAWAVYRGIPHQTPVLLGNVTVNQYGDLTAQPGVVYDYYVLQTGAVCGTHPAGAGPEQGSIGVPPVPTGLNAEDGASCAAVNVTWDATLNAASYEIRRGTNPDLAEASVLGTSATTSYADSSADPRLDYWYWVRGKGSANCTGAFQANGEPGSRRHPLLPDLAFDPQTFDAQPQGALPDGRPGLLVLNAIANLGTWPLRVIPSKIFSDGSWQFVQQTLECNHVTFRDLGRFLTPTLPDVPNTFPDFVRVRLITRFPDGTAGLEVARVDIPGLCVSDWVAYDTTLVGFSATPQFPDCEAALRGISVGWETVAPPISTEFAMDLNCVDNGTYYLEREIDPENRIYETDETNNVSRIVVTLSGLPQSSPDCTHPNCVARILGPDSLLVAAGAPTDTLTAIAWVGNRTEPEGPPDLPGFAEIGYINAGLLNRSQDDPWTWSPAQWRRQDGADDVFAASLVIAEPGEYLYAFRFRDDDGFFTYADLDGSANGFFQEKFGKIRVQTTTSVGEGERRGALELAVRSNPARGRTHFVLELPEEGAPRVTIYDPRGRLVRTIEPGLLAAGPHVVEWDGRSDDGAAARAGVYFARLDAPGGASARVKWVLAR